jgi:hypothetical protein
LSEVDVRDPAIRDVEDKHCDDGAEMIRSAVATIIGLGLGQVRVSQFVHINHLMIPFNGIKNAHPKETPRVPIDNEVTG